jgi:photosystem II stability/assembly factor-like uncharacterized protein
MPRPRSIAPVNQTLRTLWTLALAHVAGVAVMVVAVVSAPRTARADGAFPESYQLIAPADHPQQLVLGTNFGLFLSDDDGATWTWTCEQRATMNASFYNVSPPPLDRFLAISDMGLAYSDDGSCTWKAATGPITSLVARDYFADPTNALRVLVLASPVVGSPGQVLPSADGAATFEAPVFTAPATGALTGVEIARSDPQTVYVAMNTTTNTTTSTGTTTTIHPSLVRSTDGGATWTTTDVSASLGGSEFFIIAVDPLDAKVVTLRVLAADGDAVFVTRDGGTTFTKSLSVAGGTLTAYARLDDGTELLGGVVGTVGVEYKSTDGGMTFGPWTPSPTLHLRALAARGGELYAAAKNYSDDFAVGVSTDGGATFKKLMLYDEVKSIRACAQAACVDNCLYQAGLAIWDKAVCGAPTTMPPPPTPAAKSGCAVGGDGAADGAWAGGAGLALIALGLVTRARARTHRSRR